MLTCGPQSGRTSAPIIPRRVQTIREQSERTGVVYNASKAAIRSFARTWTVDLKDRHIRVNVISPGTIDTGIFVGVPKEVKDQFVSIIPMGRIGQPHEIAAAALFLASDDSSFVTGIELFVDGGTAQI